MIGQRVRAGSEQPGSHAKPMTLGPKRCGIVRRDAEQVAIDPIGYAFACRPSDHEASCVHLPGILTHEGEGSVNARSALLRPRDMAACRDRPATG